MLMSFFKKRKEKLESERSVKPGMRALYLQQERRMLILILIN